MTDKQVDAKVKKTKAAARARKKIDPGEPSAKKKPTKGKGRVKIPAWAADALDQSMRRICAMCWALAGEGTWKEGQLAHIDHDHSNSIPENLCWLCLDHHNRYDGRMNLTRNFTPKQLAAYKAEVEAEVAAGRLPSAAQPQSARLSATLEKAFIHDIGSPESGSLLEIWARFKNTGFQATGIERAYAQRSGEVINELGWLGLDKAHKTAPQHLAYAAGEYLHLLSGQVLEPGRAVKWALCFKLSTQQASEIELSAEHLDPPIEIVLEPVLGLPLTIQVNDVLVNPSGIYPYLG